MGSSNNQSVGTDKTTIFLLDGETDTVDERAESENKNEIEEESNEERKPTKNLPETTRRKIVMIKILRKSKMMTNPLFRKHPIRLPRLAEMSAFPAWWKRKVWVSLVM